MCVFRDLLMKYKKHNSTLVTKTATAYVTSKSNNTYTIENEVNMYSPASSTTYASLSGKAAQHIYLNGFNFNAIPINATIENIEATFHVSTPNSKLTASKASLCVGTTLIGDSITFHNRNETTVTLTHSTLDAKDVNNIGLYVESNANGNNNKVYIYGVTIDITYSYYE